MPSQLLYIQLFGKSEVDKCNLTQSYCRFRNHLELHGLSQYSKAPIDYKKILYHPVIKRVGHKNNNELFVLEHYIMLAFTLNGRVQLHVAATYGYLIVHFISFAWIMPDRG